MNEVFKTIVSLSISGSLLVILLLLGKCFVSKKVSRRWQYYIWLVVVIRLLCPVTFGKSLVGEFILKTDQEISRVSALIEKQDLLVIGDQFAETEQVSRNVQNLWVIWLVVAAALMIRKITIYQGFVNYVKAGRKEVADVSLLDQAAVIGGQIKETRPVELCTNSLISSPLLLGFLRPCIVLPEIPSEQRDFQHIILHEFMHFKRRDMLYKWLVQFTICIHWFNPFVYLMGREINRQCELSCDEAVMKTLDSQGRLAYGDTLIHAMESGGDYRNSVISVTLNENAKLLKERLDAIMKFERKSKFRGATELAFTVILFLCAATTGAYAKPLSGDFSHSQETESSEKQNYSYLVESYYEDPYIWEIGWDLSGYSEFQDSLTIERSDKTQMNVSFDSSCKSYMQDEDAISSITMLMEKLALRGQEAGDAIMGDPVVLNVKKIDVTELSELAEEYYVNGELTDFAAIFGALDRTVQEQYGIRMIDDGKVAYFSAVLSQVDQEMLAQYAEESYSKNKVNFFSTIVPHLAEEEKQMWIKRASEDKENGFLAVLTW